MAQEIDDVMMLFKGVIPEDRLAATIRLSDHGETTVALEVFCDQIMDEDVTLKLETYLRIKKLCDEAGISERYCNDLKDLVKEPATEHSDEFIV